MIIGAVQHGLLTLIRYEDEEDAMHQLAVSLKDESRFAPFRISGSIEIASI